MQLAQLNIAGLIAPTDDPRVAEFMENLDRINSLGKRSPGFVWIMEGDDPAAGNTDTCIDGDPHYVANLTVWEDVQSLANFVFKTVHARFRDRRAEWFEAASKPHFVMWWVEDGHRPTLDEALERLDHLRVHGATAQAFDWTHAGYRLP